MQAGMKLSPVDKLCQCSVVRHRPLYAIQVTLPDGHMGYALTCSECMAVIHTYGKDQQLIPAKERAKGELNEGRRENEAGGTPKR